MDSNSAISESRVRPLSSFLFGCLGFSVRVQPHVSGVSGSQEKGKETHQNLAGKGGGAGEEVQRKRPEEV